MMLITDEGEQIRLKITYNSDVNGEIISYAEFIPREYDSTSYVAPCTPKKNARYKTVLVDNAKTGLSIYYLEIDGEPYLNPFGQITYLCGDQNNIKNIWNGMTGE